jgi:hypothetical protein
MTIKRPPLTDWWSVIGRLSGTDFTAYTLNKSIMSDNQRNIPHNPDGGNLPAGDTGNASNPSPRDTSMEPAGGNQLIDEKGEKYLREVASIEDMPDPQEQKEAEDAMDDAANR